jgi:hypothetical protein
LRTSSTFTGRESTRDRLDGGTSTSICASLATKAKRLATSGFPTAGLESAFERGHHAFLFEAPLAHVLGSPDEEPGPGLVSLVRFDEEPAAVREQPRRRPVGVGVQHAPRHLVVSALEQREVGRGESLGRVRPQHDTELERVWVVDGRRRRREGVSADDAGRRLEGISDVDFALAVGRLHRIHLFS